jgi:hypothetical protein
VVDLAGVDGVEVTEDADGLSHVPRPARRLLRVAHRHQDAAELLVSNYSRTIGGFDPAGSVPTCRTGWRSRSP